MNIKDFLIENYIWIIVIILITIVTIIGFLADKKRGEKKEKKNQATPQNVNNQPINNQPVNNQAPIQYQQPQEMPTNLQMNNNMGLNFNNMNTTVRPLNQMNSVPFSEQQPMVTEPQVMQSMTNPVELMNNPQPVENIAPNIPQEPMYQPLSEQKPVIAPQPVPNFSAMQSPVNTGLNQVQPMPVNSVQPENVPLNVIPSMAPTMNGQSSMMMVEQTLNQAPMYNQQPQMQTIENNNLGGVPNFIPNNTTVPQPVNPIPEPKPVMPEPIMQGNYSQPSMMQPSLGQSQSVGQSNVGQVTPNTIQQPINFVYGPQNNNQNM